MTHEVSETIKGKDGYWYNYATSKRSDTNRPLRTEGKFRFKTRMEAEKAAKKRSERSNFDHGNNTIWESIKEERIMKKSTKGSPPFSLSEIRRGYRRIK